jgi:colicin import membrane protein
VSGVRVVFRVPRREGFHWFSMGGFSLLLHSGALVAAVLLPRLLHPASPLPGVYTVDLVSLPLPAPGPPSGEPAASAPAPAPVRTPEPAVKIPDKPTKPPEKKATKKPVPPKPKAEKPAPEPKPAATESAAAPEASAVEAAGHPGKSTGAGAGGEGQALSGGPGGGGGSGYLDATDFEYGWYIARISSILPSNWARPMEPDLQNPLRAVVHFIIRRDGSLTNIELEQPSGHAALDRSALRAVQDSNPLPPLPYQYGKDSLGVHFYFELKP